MQSARTVFNDVGYQAATFDDVAARVDVTRPLVSYHFVSKSDLYREAIGQPALAVIDAAQRAARHAATLPEQLRVFLRAVVEADPLDGSEYTATDLLLTAAHDSLRHRHLAGDADTVAAVRTFVTTAVRDAADRGEFDTGTELSAIIDVLASIVWGVIIYRGHAASTARLMAVIDGLEHLAANRLWRLTSGQW